MGGDQTFQPGKLAQALSDFAVVSVGAAGTFVVRKNVNQLKLRAEIWRRLPFKPELMICPARDVLALADSKPFCDAPTGKDVGRFLSVMQKAPRPLPRIPLEQPAGGPWKVRIIAVSGRFALSLRRPGRKNIYPNAAVEKLFGVSATTRNWNTIETICQILMT